MGSQPALRPYPALERFRDAMYSSLKDKVPPDGWDYPTPTAAGALAFLSSTFLSSI